MYGGDPKVGINIASYPQYSHVCGGDPDFSGVHVSPFVFPMWGVIPSLALFCTSATVFPMYVG